MLSQPTSLTTYRRGQGSNLEDNNLEQTGDLDLVVDKKGLLVSVSDKHSRERERLQTGVAVGNHKTKD